MIYGERRVIGPIIDEMIGCYSSVGLECRMRRRDAHVGVIRVISQQ